MIVGSIILRTHTGFHTVYLETAVSVRDRLAYLNLANSIETRWKWWQVCVCFYGKLMFIIQWNYIVTNIIL